MFYILFCLHPVPAKDATFNSSWRNCMAHLNSIGLFWVVACMFFTVKLKKQYHIITTQPGIAKDPWNTKWEALIFSPYLIFPISNQVFIFTFLFPFVKFVCSFGFQSELLLTHFSVWINQGIWNILSYFKIKCWDVVFGILQVSSFPKSPNNTAFTTAVLEELDLKNVGSEAKEKYLCTT